MNFDIRKAILDNIATNNRDQLQSVIVDAIDRGEEKLLPGLGVLFELIWQQSDPGERTEMLSALETGVKQTTTHHWDHN